MQQILEQRGAVMDEQLSGSERSAIWWRLGVVQSRLRELGCVTRDADDFGHARLLLMAEEQRLELLEGMA